MTGLVVDASVAVKWFVKEEFSDEASALLESDAKLVAPGLLYAEVCNALWAMHRRGDIEAEDVRDAVAALRAAPVTVPNQPDTLRAGCSGTLTVPSRCSSLTRFLKISPTPSSP